MSFGRGRGEYFYTHWWDWMFLACTKWGSRGVCFPTLPTSIKQPFPNVLKH